MPHLAATITKKRSIFLEGLLNMSMVSSRMHRQCGKKIKIGPPIGIGPGASAQASPCIKAALCIGSDLCVGLLGVVKYSRMHFTALRTMAEPTETLEKTHNCKHNYYFLVLSV